MPSFSLSFHPLIITHHTPCIFIFYFFAFFIDFPYFPRSFFLISLFPTITISSFFVLCQPVHIYSMMIQSRTVCGKSRRVHSVTCSLMEECALALTLHIFFSTVSRLVFKKYLKFRCKFRVERTHKRHAQLKWEAANEWEEIGPGC